MRYDRWSVGEQLVSAEPLGKVAGQYFNRQREASYYKEFLDEVWSDALDNSTPAFRANIGAPLYNAIPVQADQDSFMIRPALEQFGAQADPPPYTLFLLLNHTEYARPHRVTASIEAVQEFQYDRPDVPVSFGVVPFESKHFAISLLRKWGHDIGLLQSAACGAHDMLLLNHDIDLLKLKPYFLRQMYRTFTGSEQVAAVHSMMRQARTRDALGRIVFPNMDAVIGWYDLQAELQGGYYDTGNGVSARAYMEAEGYDERILEFETADLIDRICTGMPVGHQGVRFAPGAIGYTSPRRAYYKQYMGKGVHEWWGDMDNFIDTDYRTWNYQGIPDIGLLQRDVQIRQIVGDPNRLAMRIALEQRKRRPNLASAEALAIGRYSLRVAQAILGGPDDLLKRLRL